jgi:enoyl-[acyl-carrier-protein] reductase (NADH)
MLVFLCSCVLLSCVLVLSCVVCEVVDAFACLACDASATLRAVCRTYSLATDFVKDGIRCNAICPARIHTPFVVSAVASSEMLPHCVCVR